LRRPPAAAKVAVSNPDDAVPWFLHLALRQLFPTGKRFPFFTAISVLGVALGVAVLVVVISVMDGFEYKIRSMITTTEGEVQVKAQAPIPDYRSVIARIDAVPGVVAATPYSGGVVMIQFGNRAAYPFLRGVDLSTVERVADLAHYVVAGSFQDLDDDSVILGTQLAEEIGATVGDTIEIYSPLLVEKLSSDEVFLPRAVRVVGLLEIGHQQLDTSTVYCTLRLAQDLYGLGKSVHGIDVRLRDGLPSDLGAARINAALPRGIRAFSWQETWQDFLWVVNLEKSMIFFMLLFIVVVAAFSVTSSLLISVVRKTREIGLLGALGGRPRDVAACFCVQGVIIGVLGTLAGLGIGFGALAVRNDLLFALLRLTQRQDVFARFYQLNELPSHPYPGDIVRIIVLTIVISTLAGLLPAWRAARLRPVDALRSE
jgi:lipoprotein-releasing system permease protein